MFWSKQQNKRGTKPFVSAVIVAAGSSQRMGGENKLMLDIGGSPLLAHTIGAFNDAPSVNEVIVVCREQDIALYGKLREQYAFEKLTVVTVGGNSRTASAYQGLQACNAAAQIVSVHDGARPFVTVEIIEETIAAAAAHGAACPVVPVKDSIKKMAADGFIECDVRRETIVAAQTPQIFDIDVLRGALEQAQQQDVTYTDECAAVEAYGVRVFATTGDYDNIKVTTQHDLRTAEMIYQEREHEY